MSGAQQGSSSADMFDSLASAPDELHSTSHSKHLQQELQSVKQRAVLKIKTLQAEVARLNTQLREQTHDEAPRQPHDDGSSASDASATSDASDLFVRVRSPLTSQEPKARVSAAAALDQREEALLEREATLRERELELREREATIQTQQLEAAHLQEQLLHGLQQIRRNLAPALTKGLVDIEGYS